MQRIITILAQVGFLAALGSGAACSFGSNQAPPESPATAEPASPDDGKPGDDGARDRIDQAVNELYLEDKTQEAEVELLSILESCGDDCSAAVKAKGWMYIGVVRGSGAQDQDGARQAFERALQEDGSVALDEALSTPETVETFQSVKGETE